MVNITAVLTVLFLIAFGANLIIKVCKKLMDFCSDTENKDDFGGLVDKGENK